MGMRRLAFMGDTLESINGGYGVSERWLQQRPDQIKKMIAVAYRGMAHARAQRQDSIALIMSKWKMEHDVAEKAFEMMVKTWADTGVVSDRALQEGIEESLRVTKAKQAVPISQVADFKLAREVYQELKAR
jgi:ABC-type nitrate/sulfonate/bicarbonate transport system substrate-binding protein